MLQQLSACASQHCRAAILMLAEAAEADWPGLPTNLHALPLHQAMTASSRLRISSMCRHGKNINSDAWRNLQLWRHLSNPEHPMNRFSTGNIATLMDTPTSQGISVHERVSCAACATPLQFSTRHRRASATWSQAAILTVDYGQFPCASRLAKDSKAFLE